MTFKNVILLSKIELKTSLTLENYYHLSPYMARTKDFLLPLSLPLTQFLFVLLRGGLLIG